MPRLQEEATRTLNALDEGVVCCLIRLYEQNYLHCDEGYTMPPQREYFFSILEKEFNWDVDKISYWLDYFHIKN